jgi:hypothetical protein
MAVSMIRLYLIYQVPWASAPCAGVYERAGLSDFSLIIY